MPTKLPATGHRITLGVKHRIRPASSKLQGLFLAGTLALTLNATASTEVSWPGDMAQFVETAITDRNGLPQNSVNALTQTADGYLWFGTEEGLARFDGLHVTVYDTQHYKALQDNYINAIAPGRDGSLWIGTRSGVVRLKNGVFQTFLAASSPIDAIFESADSSIWVGSLDGLYRLKDNQVRHFTTMDGLPGNAVRSIVQDSDGILWIGTNKGLARVKDAALQAVDGGKGSLSDRIFDLAKSRDRGLWIATRLELRKWNGQSFEQFPMVQFPKNATVSSLFEARDGTLWIGFDHEGIAMLSNGKVSWYTTRHGLPVNDVSKVFEDRDHNLWVGLSEGGAVELRNGSFKTFAMREGLSEDMVWTVLQARDRSLWVGTDNKGLDHIELTGKVQRYGTRDGIPGGSIFALYESPDASVWIGSEHGELSHLVNGHLKVFRDPANRGGRLNAILPGPDGDLLLGFHEANGLVRFHRGEFQHSVFPGLLNTATMAPDGSIWVGTDHGGVSHIQGLKVTTYTMREGLLSDFAQAVYVDRDGVVWAGTSPGGLNRIENGHITRYSIDQGLYDLTVGAIVEDEEGYLWLTCNKGIYKVSKKELNELAQKRIRSIHSIVYTTVDGLRSAECNFAGNPAAWKGADGGLWFVTTAGIAGIDPAHSLPVTMTPSPLIEQVTFNQKRLPVGSEAMIGPGSGNLEIQYTAPNFAAPERLKFRYRLVGFESDWVEAGSRRDAIYTKLPPGHYQFDLQAGDGVSGWVGGTARWALVIQPLFWQTSWFRTIVSLLLVLLCAAVYRLRVRYLVDHARRLEEMVSRRTSELEAAVRAATSAQGALREQAQKDGLTGLWNRRALFEKIETEISRAQRDHLQIAVLMLDLDYFKVINDTHGHLIGDEVLHEIALRLGTQIRSYDFAGRYGGEEFLIVLPGCSPDDGRRRAEEIRRAIGEHPISTAAGLMQVTCSIGIAIGDGRIPSEELIRFADDALYCAKRAGRNCVCASEVSRSENTSIQSPSELSTTRFTK